MAGAAARPRGRQARHFAVPEPAAQRQAATRPGFDRGCRLPCGTPARQNHVPAARHRPLDRRAPQRARHRQMRRREIVAQLCAGAEGCRDGYTVHYARAPRLFAELELELAHGDGRFARLFRTLIKADLLILDDWGPDRLTASQRRDLMEIIEDRYGRGSTLITSQLPVEAWHEVIGEPTFADAILDRIVHNAYRLALEGPSMRKSEAAEAEAAVSTSDTSSTATTQTKPSKGARK